MARLKNATREAVDAVAGKLANKSNSNTKPANNTPSMPTATSNTSIVVPGLSSIAPDDIAGQMPQFNGESYKITDPLNPPASIPQVTESEYNARSGIYEGGIRALKLTGLAFDMTREKFTTLGKQAKAFGAGIRAAKEFEIVKGDYLDWKNQLQVTEQKSIALGVSEHKTSNDRSRAVHDNATADEKLKQAEIGADLAREQTRQKQNQLDEFRNQLGELAKSN
jgi:hypothetical protein